MDDNIKLKLLEGIEYFEKMRQAMPEDRTTLEFLSVAYGELGDRENACSSLIALARTLLKEGDTEALKHIAARLEGFDDPLAKAMVLKVNAAFSTTVDFTPEEPSKDGVSGSYNAAVKAETTLVRFLHTGKIIDDAMQDILLKKVSEMPENGKDFLISAIYFLEKENTPIAENAISYLADSTATPPIPLDSFEVTADLIRTLPESFIKVRGVIPFARLGKTVLVALLNPLDDILKREIEDLLEVPCHFFLSDPVSTENVIEHFFKPAEEKEN